MGVFITVYPCQDVSIPGNPGKETIGTGNLPKTFYVLFFKGTQLCGIFNSLFFVLFFRLKLLISRLKGSGEELDTEMMNIQPRVHI